MEPITSSSKSHQRISLDYRLIVAVLLIVIIAMFALWRPWSSDNTDRTIEVTGQASLSATPDEFVFYPTYNFQNADRQTALDELSKKSDELTGKLRGLGVASDKIKITSGGNDYPMPTGGTQTPTYGLSLTVTTGNKTLAQKVQDYLLTTSPSGNISPQANFSTKKRTELEREARTQATKDARSKAEQSAKNLGFRLGSVKSVEDDAGFDDIIRPLAADTMAKGETSPSSASALAIQPGENDLTYSVTVNYFLK